MPRDRESIEEILAELAQAHMEGQDTSAPSVINRELALASQEPINIFTSPAVTPSRELELAAQELQQKHRQAQEQQARAWLEQLDWLSSDGIWFERFARNYPNHLEAAIAYLFTSQG